MKHGGSDFVISAHRAVRRTEQGVLPDRHAGIGAVYLAHYAALHENEVPMVIPTALDIDSDERIGMAYKDTVSAVKGKDRSKEKPTATLRIGSPVVLERISREELEEISRFLTDRNAFDTTFINSEGKEEARRDQDRYQKAASQP